MKQVKKERKKTAVRKLICNSHKPTRIPKIAKELAWILLIVLVPFNSFTQTYEYSSSPSIGNYPSCPNNIENGLDIWHGGTVKMKVTEITDTEITFKIDKCNTSESFQGAGRFYIGCDADMQPPSQDPENRDIDNVYISAGSGYKYLTIEHTDLWGVINCGTSSELNFYGCFKSYESGLIYNAGFIEVYRTEITTCEEPTNLHVDNLEATSAKLDWNNVDNSDEYRVRLHNIDTDEWFSSEYTSSSYLNVNLESETRYEFKVRTYCTNGESSDYVFSDEFTSPALPCDEPTNLAVDAVGTNTADLDWSAVSGADYTVQYKKNGTSTWTSETAASSSKTLTGLLSNETYNWRVRSDCSNGANSNYVNGANFTTLNQAPSTPSNPTPSDGATSVSTTPILSWTSAAPEGGSVGYDLYLSTTNPPTMHSSGIGTSAKLKGLSMGQTYYWKVISYDSENNSSEGSVWSFSTDAIAPCNITDLNVNSETYAAVCYFMQNGIINTRETFEPTKKIIKQDIAKIIYKSLYGSKSNPSILNFPTYYQDLVDTNQTYHDYAIALSYLEFGDGISPFNRDLVYFYPSDSLYRKYYIKAVIEAFNIPTDITLENPYTDVDPTDDMYKYIISAYHSKLLNNKLTEFRPNEGVTREEAVLILYRLLQSNDIDKPTNEALGNLDNYYIPLNLTRLNSASNYGTLKGVFNNYTKAGFSMSDIGFSLDFSIIYNSYLSELPKQLFSNKTLSEGWTHNYNIHLTELPAAKFQGDALDGTNIIELNTIAITYPNGTVSYFANTDGYPALSNGVYSTLEKIEGGGYKLTTKGKTVFEFTEITNNDFGDNVYLITLITDKNNNHLVFSYLDGKLNFVEGESGRKLNFIYTNGKLTNVSETGLNRSVYIIYKNDNISSFIDAESKETKYFYNSSQAPHHNHLLDSIIFSKGNYIVANYNQRRRLNGIKTSKGEGIIINHDVLNNNTVYQTFLNNKTQTYNISFVDKGNTNAFNDAYGQIETITGSGINTTLTYASSEQPHLPSAITSNNVTIEIDYNEKGDIIEKRFNGLKESYEYDSKFNVLTKYTNPRGYSTTFTLDANGNIENITDALQNSTTIGYYDNGLPQYVENPEGIKVEYFYDSKGNLERIKAPEGIETSMTYDNAGRPDSYTIDGKTQYFTYDHVNNLRTEKDVLGYITEYVYDDNYNLERIINAKGNPTILTYDSDDLLKTISFGGFTKIFTFDDEGILQSIQKPSGNLYEYEFDDSLRLKSNGYIENITYFEEGIKKNSIHTAQNENGIIEFDYDEYGRMNFHKDYFGNEIQYEHDNNGNIKKIIYPDNKELFYVYDVTDKLKSVKALWLNKTIIQYDYRDDGLLETETYGNGIECHYKYDDAGRMEEKIYVYENGDTLQGWEYNYDLSSNLVDDVPPYKKLFASNADITPQSLEYVANDVNRFVEIQGTVNKTFDYDPDGNTKEKSNRIYDYDLNDMLTSVSGDFTAAYKYDAFGNRREASRNGNTVRYILDMNGMTNILAEANESNNINWYYVHGIGMAARIDADGNIQYYHHDFRGSTVAITDENETITHKYEYDEWGNCLQNEEVNYNEFRLVGKYGVTYETTDLHFMRARFYDSEIGRFISEDPVWSTNLYPYAGNNPISNIDPNGKEFMDWVHGALDVAGLIPGLGEPFDAINGLIYLAEGDYTNAALSAAAMIPIAGVGATVTKNIIKHGDEVVTLATKHGGDISNIVSKNSKRVAETWEEWSAMNKTVRGKVKVGDIFAKGTPVEGLDPFLYRKDASGKIIKLTEHGKYSELGWHADHIYPRSKGGWDCLFNYAPLNWHSNIKKSDNIIFALPLK